MSITMLIFKVYSFILFYALIPQFVILFAFGVCILFLFTTRMFLLYFCCLFLFVYYVPLLIVDVWNDLNTVIIIDF